MRGNFGVRILPGLFARTDAAQAEQARIRQRIVAVLDTVTGVRLAGLVQSARQFEEHARFGASDAPQEGACLFLAREIESLMNTASADSARDSYLVLPCPAIALGDGNTPIACDAAARRAGLLHQEICLEFPGSALEADSVARLARLKQTGFRLGLDLRKSGPVALNEALRVLIDTIRLDARDLDQAPAYSGMLDAASQTRVLVVAEQAHWRDGASLARRGVRGFVRPRTDA